MKTRQTNKEARAEKENKTNQILDEAQRCGATSHGYFASIQLKDAIVHLNSLRSDFLKEPKDATCSVRYMQEVTKEVNTVWENALRQHNSQAFPILLYNPETGDKIDESLAAFNERVQEAKSSLAFIVAVRGGTDE